MGSVQVTDTPLDSVVEITAFQSLMGRLFGCGDLVVALVSSGVTETLKPRETEPVRSTYRVT